MANSTGIAGVLDSPRRQRQFLIVSIAVFAVGMIAFVSVYLLRGTGNAFTDTFSNQPAKLAEAEKTVPVTKTQVDSDAHLHPDGGRRKNWPTPTRSSLPTSGADDVEGLGDREHPDRPVRGGELEDGGVRAGLSLRDLGPLQRRPDPGRPHAEPPELMFSIGLKRAGGTKTGRWLVDYWQPRWRPPVPAAPG